MEPGEMIGCGYLMDIWHTEGDAGVLSVGVEDAGIIFHLHVPHLGVSRGWRCGEGYMDAKNPGTFLGFRGTVIGEEFETVLQFACTEVDCTKIWEVESFECFESATAS